MDVYLIPLGDARHELYCEFEGTSFGADPAASTDGASWWQRKKARLQEMIAEAEADRDRQARTESGEPGGDRDPASPRKRRSLGRIIVARIAEAVAEQRLLWHLRGETRARLVHPDDMSGPQALATARAMMAADFAKHRRWCAIDAVIAAITGPVLFFVPGPNVIAWYFFFRAVGHYYALRGARQGVTVITWDTVPAGALSTLRLALGLDPSERRARIDELAAGLGLGRLTAFVERLAAGRT